MIVSLTIAHFLRRSLIVLNDLNMEIMTTSFSTQLFSHRCKFDLLTETVKSEQFVKIQANYTQSGANYNTKAKTQWQSELMYRTKARQQK